MPNLLPDLGAIVRDLVERVRRLEGYRIPQVDKQYVQLTSSLTGVSTETDIITLPNMTFDGETTIKLSFSWSSLASTVAGDRAAIRIKSTTNQYMSGQWVLTTTAATAGGTLETIFKPASGTTYAFKATLAREAGTGTITLAAGSNAPATLTVEEFA